MIAIISHYRKPQWIITKRTFVTHNKQNLSLLTILENPDFARLTFYGVYEHPYKPNKGSFRSVFKSKKTYPHACPTMIFDTQEQARLRMKHVVNSYLNGIRHEILHTYPSIHPQAMRIFENTPDKFILLWKFLMVETRPRGLVWQIRSTEEAEIKNCENKSISKNREIDPW